MREMPHQILIAPENLNVLKEEFKIIGGLAQTFPKPQNPSRKIKRRLLRVS